MTLAINRTPHIYFDFYFAGVAQLVEHNLPKVRVESSSLFAR